MRVIAILVTLACLTVPTAASAAPFDPGPDRYPGMVLERDHPIVMRDGVKLFADVYRPAQADGTAAPGKFPTILTITAYNKLSGVASVEELFVRHGYNHVVVDARGTGSSEGTWESWGEPERRDYPDVVEWAAHQPWSDGRTGMYGNSYMAFTQIMAAAYQPPSLKAIVPIIPADDTYRDITWLGGNISPGFVPLWLGLVTALKVIPPTYTASDPVQAAKVLGERGTTGARFPVMTPADALAGGDGGYDGPFYQERSPGHYANRIDVPTLMAGGWFDIFQRGTPRLYDKLPLPDSKKKLLMGPWYHITAGEGLGQEGTPPNLNVLALAWFERWIRGVDNGIDKFPNVSLYQLGADRWETTDSWPRRDVEWQRWYLRGEKSGSAQSLNDGSLSTTPPPAERSDSGVLDNPNGTCSRSIVQWSAGIERIPGCETDNRVQELTALTYTTEPMRQPLHISGPIGLTLRGSANTTDSSWTAILTDVAPDGTSTQITAGWLRAAMRQLDEKQSVRAPNGDVVVPYHPFTKESERPLAPDEVATLNIEIFNTNLVLQPGHRLRLTINGTDAPNHQPTVPNQLRTAGQIHEVHYGPKEPSFLTLPIVNPLLRVARARAESRSCVRRGRVALRVRAPRGTGHVRRARASVDGRRARIRRTRAGWRVSADLRRARGRTARLRVLFEDRRGKPHRLSRTLRLCRR
jgi:putative CocE/NonD family hydrolase